MHVYIFLYQNLLLLLRYLLFKRTIIFKKIKLYVAEEAAVMIGQLTD